MENKKIVDVTTEIEKGVEQPLIGDVVHVLSGGLVKSGSTSDTHTATVTYDDGTVSTGTGSTANEAIKNATK